MGKAFTVYRNAIRLCPFFIFTDTNPYFNIIITLSCSAEPSGNNCAVRQGQNS